MTSSGSHPLDIDLADLVDGNLDHVRAAGMEAHLAACLLCRVKRLRLGSAPPAGAFGGGGPLPSPMFAVPAVDDSADPVVGDLWLAGGEERVLVLVLGAHGDRVLAAPVTFDVEAADETAVVVDAGRSPLGTGIVVHPALAAELPRAALAGRVAASATATDLPGGGPGTTRGAPVVGDTDPRLELRRQLADRLAELGTRPSTAAGALIEDLRALRGSACEVQALDAWPGVEGAEANGWVPLATVDEVGVVLVVLDTPHGLVDDRDFDAARAVLTRCNASALVVLAGELSELAEVFDASALNHGIDMPSGAHTPPRPLIAGLVAYDAVAKYLDQHSGARAMNPPTRGPVAHVDVAALLGEAAVAAATEAVRKGGRSKILPKRRGYESLAGAAGSLGAALGTAFAGGSVVEALTELAVRSPEDGP